MFRQRTAFEILSAVKETYTGARGHFVMCRLSLRTGTDLASLKDGDTKPGLDVKLAAAVAEICPDVKL